MMALALAGFLSSCLGKPSSWSAFIDAQVEMNSSRYRVPAEWIRAVITVESGGCTLREGGPLRSKAGAVGLMQLMKPTWQEISSTYGLGPSIDDPAANIAAGVAYLRLMYDRFGYPGVFAAYNAGPGRYRASLSGRPLPIETRHYVHAVLSLLAGLQSIKNKGSLGSEAKVPSLFVIYVKDGSHGSGLHGHVADVSESSLLFSLR
jgi:soluble lytic murein transglycosylase-like protein